jgi:hypothetical protein
MDHAAAINLIMQAFPHYSLQDAMEQLNRCLANTDGAAIRDVLQAEFGITAPQDGPTVADSLPSPGWMDALDTDVLACPIDSVVGELVINYLRAADALIALTDEKSEQADITAAVIRQCNVWYFA